METGKGAIIPNSKRKLGALKHTSNKASFKDKKRLADGVIMSRLTYGIAIWGLNAAKTTINKVQIVQNLTMKWVTGINVGISTKQLLDKLDWLSIYQLAIYHSVLLYWKVNNKQEPSRTVEILQSSLNSNPRIELTGRIWSKVATTYFNKLDPNVQNLKKIGAFKRALKNWIKLNVPLSEDTGDPNL